MVSGVGIQGGGCDDAMIRSSEVRVWLICRLWWAWVLGLDGVWVWVGSKMDCCAAGEGYHHGELQCSFQIIRRRKGRETWLRAGVGSIKVVS